MIKQPISLFRGQATDLEIQRQEIRQTKQQLVEILAKGCGKSEEEMERDISRPKYFTPYQAVEYGLIDKVCVVPGWNEGVLPMVSVIGGERVRVAESGLRARRCESGDQTLRCREMRVRL